MGTDYEFDPEEETFEEFIKFILTRIKEKNYGQYRMSFNDQVIALFGRIQIFCLKDIKEYLDNKDTENLKLYIQKNFKLIDEDVINAVCKKLLD